MIARINRFHGHNSLNFVYRHGKTIHTPQISLKMVHNQRQENWRVAIVVSKKVNKSAVVRNRIRRKLYEAIRQHRPPISQPLDIVLTVFDGEMVNMSVGDIEDLLSKLYKQADLR